MSLTVSGRRLTSTGTSLDTTTACPDARSAIASGVGESSSNIVSSPPHASLSLVKSSFRSKSSLPALMTTAMVSVSRPGVRVPRRVPETIALFIQSGSMKSPEDFCPGDTGSRAGRLVGDPGAGPLETTRGKTR